MSKALTKAQTDLDALKAELEAWITTYVPPAPVRRAPKPAIKRTRAQLLEAATALPVAPALPVEPVQDVDTSWLDLLAPAAPVVPAVAAPAVAAPVEPPHVPEPATAPLYVDATHLIRIELEPAHILDLTAHPQPEPKRRTFRQAFMDGYNS